MNFLVRFGQWMFLKPFGYIAVREDLLKEAYENHQMLVTHLDNIMTISLILEETSKIKSTDGNVVHVDFTE